MRRVLVSLLGLALAAGCSRAPALPEGVGALLDQYGWQATGAARPQEWTLPPPPNPPMGGAIDQWPWARLRPMVQAIGMDFVPYAGQQVTQVSVPVRHKEHQIRAGRQAEAVFWLHPADGVIAAYICAPPPADEIRAGDFFCYAMNATEFP